MQTRGMVNVETLRIQLLYHSEPPEFTLCTIPVTMMIFVFCRLLPF